MCGYIQVPANCCFSQACSGSGPLSESDRAGYILAPEYHLGHLSSISGNSSFNTRRYQPFRCPCLAWIGHVHALLRMIPFCPHVISNCVVPMAFLFLPSHTLPLHTQSSLCETQPCMLGIDSLHKRKKQVAHVLLPKHIPSNWSMHLHASPCSLFLCMCPTPVVESIVYLKSRMRHRNESRKTKCVS